MLNRQTHIKPQEPLQLNLTEPRETFAFEPPISIKGCWMLELTYLEVYFFSKKNRSNYQVQTLSSLQ